MFHGLRQTEMTPCIANTTSNEAVEEESIVMFTEMSSEQLPPVGVIFHLVNRPIHRNGACPLTSYLTHI